MPKFRFLQVDGQPVPAWIPSKTLTNALTTADDERLRNAAEEEYRRLLYVGMTRAADRLIVCGYRGKLDNDGSWQAMIARGLAANSDLCLPAQFLTNGEEWAGYRWRAPAAHSARCHAKRLGMRSGLISGCQRRLMHRRHPCRLCPAL